MSGPWICCEECGEPVLAESTHNGVMPCLHYVHCGWGHTAHPDDGFPSPQEALNDRVSAREISKEANNVR